MDVFSCRIPGVVLYVLMPFLWEIRHQRHAVGQVGALFKKSWRSQQRMPFFLNGEMPIPFSVKPLQRHLSSVETARLLVYVGVSIVIGVPPSHHPFLGGIFPDMNHLEICWGNPMTSWTPPSGDTHP